MRSAISITAGWSSTLAICGNAEPSGKYGTQAMSFARQTSSTASAERSSTLYGVLHADDPGRQRRLDLLHADVAEADPADLALVAQGDQFGQLRVQVDPLIALGNDARWDRRRGAG